MFNWLHSKTNQSVNSWISNGVFAYIAAGAVITTPLAILSKMSPGWFGNLNWAQAILFGIADFIIVTLAAVIVLAIGAWAFRKFRPIESLPVTQSAARAAPAQPSDEEALKVVVHALAERVSGLIKQIEPFEAKLEEQARRFAVMVQTLEQKAEQVRVDGAIATRDIEKLAEVQKDHRHRALLSLKAVGDRERLTDLKGQIRDVAIDLSQRLDAGEHYDMNAWNSWLSCHAVWNSRLQEWLETAHWFAKGVKETTLTVNDSDYGGEWHVADSQFHSSEAVRQFKKFYIIHRQWEKVIPSVEAGMAQVAFGGMTDLEVRGG